jgi:hypothetical protein
MRYALVACGLLAGCATEHETVYVNAGHGYPSAALEAKCRGEVASAMVGRQVNIWTRDAYVETIFGGCMGRHGFTARPYPANP